MQGSRGTPQAARRVKVGSWRTPRLIAGVAFVALATALGGWLAVTASGEERYWVLREDVRAGDPVSPEQLATTTARLDAASAATIVDAETPVATDGVWGHDVAAGAFVPASVWVAAVPSGHELPMSVREGAFPADLERGDVVDVWTGPGPQQAGVEAQRVLAGVTVRSVVAAPTGGAATVVVDVGGETPSAQAVAQVGSLHVTVVRRS